MKLILRALWSAVLWCEAFGQGFWTAIDLVGEAVTESVKVFWPLWLVWLFVLCCWVEVLR